MPTTSQRKANEGVWASRVAAELEVMRGERVSRVGYQDYDHARDWLSSYQTNTSCCPTRFTSTSSCSVKYRNGSSAKVPLSIMPAVTPLPTVQSWTALKKNVHADDTLHLESLPYMSDLDASFTEELVTEFYEGQVGRAASLSPGTLVLLVNRLCAKHLYGQTPTPEVFEGIATETGGVGSQLAECYEETCKPKKLMENVDATMTRTLPPEESCHSFQILYCRLCSVHDCQLHPYKQPIPQFVRAAGVGGDIVACGATCFLSKRKAGRASVSSGVSWTHSDATVLLALNKVLGDRTCEIAKLLGSKTCQQVHLYLKDKKLLGVEQPLPRTPAKAVPSKGAVYKIYEMHKRRNGHRSQYIPCACRGKCVKGSCGCEKANNPCEKFCVCALNCSYRFAGCRCRNNCSVQCPCLLANRECDPDLCTVCISSEVEESAGCRNRSIQRGLAKRLLAAPSDIAGWGCFVAEDVAKNQFISEYCGEVISQDEADRRGKIYDKMQCSFLFNLNDECCVDATRRGNKIRFANHSQRPNCYARVMMVNGDHRIGIFAARDVCAGEELFFDYKYGQAHLQFVAVEKPEAPVQPVK